MILPSSPLYIPIVTGNIQYLQKHEDDIEDDRDMEHVLRFAAEYGQARVFHALAHRIHEIRPSVWHEIGFYKRLDILAWLQSQGFVPQQELLMGAVMADHIDLVESWLQQEMFDMNTLTFDGETILGNIYSLEMATILLRHGADPNLKTGWGQPVIMEALDLEVLQDREWVSFARLLLQWGADPNASDERGQSILEMVIQALEVVDERTQAVKLLLDAGANPSKVRLENIESPELRALIQMA